MRRFELMGSEAVRSASPLETMPAICVAGRFGDQGRMACPVSSSSATSAPTRGILLDAMIRNWGSDE